MTLVTKERLAAAGACSVQLKQWIKLWPHGMKPTVENLTITAAHGISAWWMHTLVPRIDHSSWNRGMHRYIDLSGDAFNGDVGTGSELALLAALLQEAP